MKASMAAAIEEYEQSSVHPNIRRAKEQKLCQTDCCMALKGHHLTAVGEQFWADAEGDERAVRHRVQTYLLW